MSQWVQHISGQGEKWKVVLFPQDCGPAEMACTDQWKVENHTPGALSFYHYVPRSEYVLCDPPEQWLDVTADCEPCAGSIVHRDGEQRIPVHTAQWFNEGVYRLRKVLVSLRIGDFAASAATGQQGWAFLVERRRP